MENPPLFSAQLVLRGALLQAKGLGSGENSQRWLQAVRMDGVVVSHSAKM